jgi:hypothetical protein
MIAALTGFWFGLPKWVRDALMIAGAVLAVIFLGRKYVKNKQNEAVRDARVKWDADAREVESQVINNINENTNEVIRESDAVRSRPAVVELPDGTQGLPEYHYRD